MNKTNTDKIICKNCKHTAIDNFCSACGQSTKTSRIDLHNIVHNFMHGILHVDQGFFYTMKELTLRPGKTIRSYFEGKRVSYFNPFGYFFLIATIYVFISHFAEQPLFLDIKTEVNEANEQTEQVESFFRTIKYIFDNHYSIIMLCLTPVTAFATSLFFRATRYNYGEHLILNLYILGHQILANIICIPIGYYTNVDKMFQWASLLQLIIFVYMIASVFNSYKLWKRILFPICIQALITILTIFVVLAVIVIKMFLTV